MKCSIAGLFCVLVACSEASVFFRGGNDLPLLDEDLPLLEEEESVCPPPEQISPCTCFKSPEHSNRTTAQCSNFTNPEDLEAIFTKNPNWNIQDVQIDGAIMQYIPSVMFEKAVFQTLNVSSSTLRNLFEETIVNTTELNLYLHNVKILGGVDWSSIARANLLEFGAWNTTIRKFGKEFKKYIPVTVKGLWFENTNTQKITDRAFENLKNVATMTLKGGSLKVISRDMFPRPWNVTFLDFSFHKIATLPEDIFADMPLLANFTFQGNLLTTLPGKAFIKSSVLFTFVGNPLNCNCNMKWITEPGKITPTLFKGACTEPKSFKGRELASLKKSEFGFCV